jgi:hypothetical protein
MYSTIKTLFGAALFAASAAMIPSKADAVTFEVDLAGSSVDLRQTGSSFLCTLTSCGVEATLASGLGSTTFDLDSAGESESFEFFTLAGDGGFSFGGTTFDIVATLAFNPPNFSATGNGFGGSLILAGQIALGVLIWDDLPTTLTLDDGSIVTVDFADGFFSEFISGPVSVAASVTLDSLGSPTPVPLPASLVLLLAALGGLVLVGRNRKLAPAHA